MRFSISSTREAISDAAAHILLHQGSAGIGGTAVDVELQADDLLSMLAELPAGYRTVFNLYALEGFGHQEIADMLGISEGTSKSQYSRARVILQSKLERLSAPRRHVS